jgi:hypothetical protein
MYTLRGFKFNIGRRPTIQLLIDLGLIINLDKCHLVPSQIITYLGAVFNLNKGLVLPSENRFLAIVDCRDAHLLRPLVW